MILLRLLLAGLTVLMLLVLFVGFFGVRILIPFFVIVELGLLSESLVVSTLFKSSLGVKVIGLSAVFTQDVHVITDANIDNLTPAPRETLDVFFFI